MINAATFFIKVCSQTPANFFQLKPFFSVNIRSIHVPNLFWLILFFAADALLAQEITLFSNENAAAVQSSPSSDTSFLLEKPALITYLRTYHWNGGSGVRAGTIEVLNDQNESVGKWNAQLYNQVFWVIKPNVLLQKGRYVIKDSSPQTWSYNAQSNNAGIATVNGVFQSLDSGASNTEPKPNEVKPIDGFRKLISATEFGSMTLEQRAKKVCGTEKKPPLPFWELMKIETVNDTLDRDWLTTYRQVTGNLIQSDGYIMDEFWSDWVDNKTGVTHRANFKFEVYFWFAPSGYLLPGKKVFFTADASLKKGGALMPPEMDAFQELNVFANVGAHNCFGKPDGTTRGLKGPGTIRLTGQSLPIPEGVPGDEMIIGVDLGGGCGGGWVHYHYIFRTQ